MTRLYHGSTVQNLRALEPRKRFTPAKEIKFSAIYASPSRAFAMCHSFSWTTDEGIVLEIKDDKVYLTVPEKIRERLQSSVSLYTVDASTFVPTLEERTGYTYHSTKLVSVLEETQYASVEEGVLAEGAILSFV